MTNTTPPKPTIRERIEQILRNRILFIGNELPDTFTTDKRDKQLYLGYPQQLIDELSALLSPQIGGSKTDETGGQGGGAIGSRKVTYHFPQLPSLPQPPLQGKQDWEEILQWARNEVEPYFQGDFGTMDTMIDLFIDELGERIAHSIQIAVEEERERIRKEIGKKTHRDEYQAVVVFMDDIDELLSSPQKP